MVKAVYLDFDGTLYSHKSNCVPKSAIEAIKTLRKNNIKVFLCTGRSPAEMNYFELGDIKFDGYIFNNGQIVFDQDKNIIYKQAIEGKLKEILVKIFNENLMPTLFVTIDDLYLNHVDDNVIASQNNINSPIPEIKKYGGEPIYMCSIFLKDKKDLDKYNINEYGEITYWQNEAVDICPKNVSKVTGIKEANKHFGFEFDEVMAIGDGHNDMEMIKACGVGVCLGNGKDEVKNISDYVTTDIDEDGLYNAFKHYGLI